MKDASFYNDDNYAFHGKSLILLWTMQVCYTDGVSYSNLGGVFS